MDDTEAGQVSAGPEFLPQDLTLADGPELQFAPWYARYESGPASNEAWDALLTTAVRTHDLAPVLPFAEVYGPGGASLGRATATSNYPDERPAPDSPITRAHLELDQDALAMAVFHPGRGVRAGGPANGRELENSLFWVSPPLPALRAVELPGVDPRFVNFCAGWLEVNAVDEFWELGRSFGAAWPDYRDAIEAGLLHLIRERPLTVEQWHGLTHVRFAGVDELTCHLRQVHRLLYGMPSSKMT